MSLLTNVALQPLLRHSDPGFISTLRSSSSSTPGAEGGAGVGDKARDCVGGFGVEEYTSFPEGESDTVNVVVADGFVTSALTTSSVW